MKDVHITANSWVPIGAVSATIGFIIASVLWAAQIEAKAESAMKDSASIKESLTKYEVQIDKRLERIEAKLDKVLEK
jgi:hypothetical protein